MTITAKGQVVLTDGSSLTLGPVDIPGSSLWLLELVQADPHEIRSATAQITNFDLVQLGRMVDAALSLRGLNFRNGAIQ